MHWTRQLNSSGDLRLRVHERCLHFPAFTRLVRPEDLVYTIYDVLTYLRLHTTRLCTGNPFVTHGRINRNIYIDVYVVLRHVITFFYIQLELYNLQNINAALNTPA